MSSQHLADGDAGSRRRALPSGLALAGTAVAFMSLYLGAGALTPLLVDYKARFHFAPEMLNVAFAVYAAGFLVAVLTLGSLSDYIGRRPVLIGGLIVQLASNLLFLTAADVSWVIAGRIIQGIASGAATSAFTAAMVELAPERNKRLGTILGSVSLTGGLAPNMVRSVFGIDSAFLGGFAGFVAPAVSTVIGLVFAKVPSRRAMVIGIYASIVGAAAIIGGVFAGSLAIMIIGQAIAGIGFGSSFTAALQLLIPLVQPQQRAGIVAAIYVVSYAAFGLPIVIEGQLVAPLGEIPAVVYYTGLTLLLALISLIARARIKRQA